MRVFKPEIGALWFYEGETLGYRTAFLFSPEEDVLVAAATNSQPSGEQDKLVPMLAKLFVMAKEARNEGPCPAAIDRMGYRCARVGEMPVRRIPDQALTYCESMGGVAVGDAP